MFPIDGVNSQSFACIYPSDSEWKMSETIDYFQSKLIANKAIKERRKTVSETLCLQESMKENTENIKFSCLSK
jgi:hypothetical protein